MLSPHGLYMIKEYYTLKPDSASVCSRLQSGALLGWSVRCSSWNQDDGLFAGLSSTVEAGRGNGRAAPG